MSYLENIQHDVNILQQFSSVSQLLGAKSSVINLTVFGQAVLEAMESHPKESDIQLAGR